MNAGGVLNTCKLNEEVRVLALRLTEWRTGE